MHGLCAGLLSEFFRTFHPAWISKKTFMPSGKRKISRRKKIRKFLRVTGAVLGVALIAVVFYFAATAGPRSPDAAPRQVTVDSAMADESRELFARFERAVGEGTPDENEMEMLRRAITLQRDFNSAAGSVGLEHRRHLEEMEARLSNYQARELAERSREAEEEADAHEGEGRATEALAAVERAWELQREINSRHGRSSYRDTGREARLQLRKMTMETEPVHRRSMELETLGLAAAESRDWADARRLLNEASALQKQINDTGRRNRFHDSSRLDRLNEAIAGLAVGEMSGEVDNLAERAADLEQDGRFDEAAQLFERAMLLQNQINRDHPQSPFVSLPRVSELDSARQRALSGPRLREVETALASLRSSLRAGDMPGVRGGLADANEKIRHLNELFPRSSLLDFTVRLQLDYLDNVKENLPSLQSVLLEDLVDLPGQGGARMKRTEVSQSLYQQIMNANPSRNTGAGLPVDSLTLSQARDFCRRAGWILGRPVDLPTREQFAAALDEAERGGAAAEEGKAIDAVTAGAPNAHGFIHLVGNIGQWLADEPDEGRGLVAGGRFAEPESLFREVNRNERSRSIGFRYVVAGESGE